jgi:hypothetical protein
MCEVQPLLGLLPEAIRCYGRPWEEMLVCHKAWCARLAWFLKCIGVLICEEMDMCNPPRVTAYMRTRTHVRTEKPQTPHKPG